MEHAVVRVYDTRSYKVFGEPLQGHILTITRISFSPDDKLILTVSRDRTWRLFEAQSENGKYPIILLLLLPIKHLVQAIFQLPLKRLMPVSSGIVDGQLKEMYSQRHHVTRRYILIVHAFLFPYLILIRDIGENLESEWREVENCVYSDHRPTGHSSSIYFLEGKQKVRLFSRICIYTHNYIACRRRYLAVGLESGEILIYSTLSSSVEDWQLNFTIDSW
jgi:elongator complex protein 2